MSEFYTTIKMYDGFGAQYQKIVQTYIYCKMNNLNFAYSPIDSIEHNYENDVTYVNKLEKTMNLENNIVNVDKNMVLHRIEFPIVREFSEKNIDICCESEHMKFIKDCFWGNKEKDYFKNDKLNVAIHIRRANLHDKGLAGQRVTTPNSYYLNIMNKIREKYKDKDKQVLFHIYSQGDETKFIDLVNSDVKMYLNYDIIESFIGMVAADILVTSPSSLSYVAALISDGEIYYKKFWHNPRKNWIICG